MIKMWIAWFFILLVIVLFIGYPLYLCISSTIPSFFSNEEKLRCLKTKFNIRISNYKDEEKKKFWSKIFNKVLNIPMNEVRVDKYGNGAFKSFAFDNVDIYFDILHDSRFIDMIYVKDSDDRIQAKVETDYNDRYVTKIIADVFYIRLREYLDNYQLQEMKEKIEQNKRFIKEANEILGDE